MKTNYKDEKDPKHEALQWAKRKQKIPTPHTIYQMPPGPKEKITTQNWQNANQDTTTIKKKSIHKKHPKTNSSIKPENINLKPTWLYSALHQFPPFE